MINHLSVLLLYQCVFYQQSTLFTVTTTHNIQTEQVITLVWCTQQWYDRYGYSLHSTLQVIVCAMVAGVPLYARSVVVRMV
jgi:hypothetical protein